MLSWRVPGALALMLAALPAQAQSAKLVEMVKPGECFEYRLSMKLSGELRIRKKDAPATIKLSGSAEHAFRERIMASRSAVAQRVVRRYEKARADLAVGRDRTERTLREKRRLIVAQRHKDVRLTYCPAGSLTRRELEVAGDHFDTLAIAGCLAGKEVKVGDTWKIAPGLASALCNLEGASESKLEGKLKKVVVDRAHFTITGTVMGVEHGAQVKTTVQAEGTFDLGTKRLVKLEWAQTDERDQGPVSPASTIKVNVTVARKPIEQPADLADVALVSVPSDFTPPAEMTHVEFRDAKGRYLLYHARDWQLVAVTADHAVLRLVERGDFIAQVTIAPWEKAAKGKHLSPDEFRTAMNRSSGWRPEREVQADKVPSTDGKYIYRLSVQGQLDGVQVLQTFFLVANGEGDQVVVTFTMPPRNADKLGARDLSLVGSLEVPAPAEKK